jgi:hypothetical protein
VTEATLPSLPQAAVHESAAEPSTDWLRAARRAKQLSWLSLAWMGAEGAIAITAGILAGSIALIGFGIDSAIEGVASLVIVWRFTGHRLLSHAAEERAQKLVAIQFFLLAPYVAFEAIRHLVGADRPDITVLGMALTATSLVGMPFLGMAKQRLADTLDSSATHGEGSQNLICALPARSSSASPAMPSSAGGGSTRSRRSPSPASRSGRAPRPGAARVAAPPRSSPRRRAARTTAATSTRGLPIATLDVLSTPLFAACLPGVPGFRTAIHD